MYFINTFSDSSQHPIKNNVCFPSVIKSYLTKTGPGECSTVTHYRLDNLGIESWGVWVGGEIFCNCSTGPLAYPASYTMWTGSPSQGVKWPGSGIHHQTPTGAKVKKEYSTISTHLLGLCGLFYSELCPFF